MLYDLSAAPVPLNLNLPYDEVINNAMTKHDLWPCLAYAIAWRETIRGQMNGWWLPESAASVVSFDNGRGLFQLTESCPDDWNDPSVNAEYAATEFIQPAVSFWTAAGPYHYSGMTLAKAVFAEFNAGRGAVENAISTGQQIDSVTTGGDYAADAWGVYQSLLRGQRPT